MFLTALKKKLKKVEGVGPFISQLKGFFERFRSRKGTAVTILGGVLIYFIIPADVIPDYTFPIGYIDDAIAVKLTLNVLSAKDESKHTV